MNRLDPLMALSSRALERTVLTAPWPVARDLRLSEDGERLAWASGDSEAPWVEATPGLLSDFVALRDADADAVLSYASRHGVLYLCHHGAPAGHPAQWWPGAAIEAHACPFDERGRLTTEALAWDEYLRAQNAGEDVEPPPIEDWPEPAHSDHHRCLPLGLQTGDPWEPVAVWREWAARAYALLSIAADLRVAAPHRLKIDAGRGLWRPEDWRTASGLERHFPEPQTAEECWRVVEHYANSWLAAASVRPWIAPSNGDVGLTLGSSRGNSPLFGALAVQLALAVSGAEGFAVCSGCGTLYAPRTKPRPGQRNYCQECRRRKVPQKLAARDYYARERKTKRKK